MEILFKNNKALYKITDPTYQDPPYLNPSNSTTYRVKSYLEYLEKLYKGAKKLKPHNKNEKEGKEQTLNTIERLREFIRKNRDMYANYKGRTDILKYIHNQFNN